MNKTIIAAFLASVLCEPLQSSAQIDRNIIKKPIKGMTLRSDGLYNTYDTSLMKCGERRNIHYSLFETLIIINSDKVIYNYGEGDLNFEPLKTIYYNDKFLLPSVGNYNIDGKLIKASVPIGLMLRGMRLKTFIAHFEGEIKNRDTVINWHMVEPYPEAPPQFNNNFQSLIKPKLLYFIESKELLGLDSLYQQRLREDSNKKN